MQTELKIITIPNFKIKWSDFDGPCYDPQERYGDCPETFLDLLNDERIPTKDKIWAFAYKPLVPDHIKRQFAVRCMRETPMKNGGVVADRMKDQRSKDALRVAWDFTEGKATKEELERAAAARLFQSSLIRQAING